MHIAVLGAGAWGAALAMQLVRAGRQVSLWTYRAEAATQLQQSRMVAQLTHCPLPEEVRVSADLVACVSGAQGVLIAVPSHAFTPLLQQLAQLPSGVLPSFVAWATKGFDPVSHRLLHQQVAHYLPQATGTVLSGPTFANEVAHGLPTAIVAASDQVEASDWWASRLHSQTFRVYTNTDVLGVEIGGALKNVMAIAAGVSDGLGFGANARAALVSRALAEVMRLGIGLGAKPDTFMGLAGLGDLVLTCTDNQSRNRRFGLAIASGSAAAMAEQDIGTVEGIAAVKSAVALAKQYQLDMPIAQAVYAVIKGQVSPRDAVANLLARAPKAEGQ
jgi:glycerol-3-phosphate dehydrogenase (NAD(P)+)